MSDLNDEIIAILPDLRRYARSLSRSDHDAEDLLHDCVERVLTKSDLFRRGSNLRAWMFTTMRNIFLSGKRRQKVFERYVASGNHSATSTTQAGQLNRYFLAQTMEAVSRLSHEEREAMRLLVIEERRHREAADEVGQPIGTMKSRLSRGRSKLRASLKINDTYSFEATQVA